MRIEAPTTDQPITDPTVDPLSTQARTVIGSIAVCGIGYIGRIERRAFTGYGKWAWCGTSLRGLPWSSTMPVILDTEDQELLKPQFDRIAPSTELSAGSGEKYKDGTSAVVPPYYAIHLIGGGYLASTSRYDGNDDTDTSLGREVSDPLMAWRVLDAGQAQHTIEFPPQSYNSTEDSPSCRYAAKDLIVVEVRANVTVAPVEVELPSIQEYLTLAYGPNGREDNPAHYAYVMKEAADGNIGAYSWGEYKLLRSDLEGRSARKTKSRLL